MSTTPPPPPPPGSTPPPPHGGAPYRGSGNAKADAKAAKAYAKASRPFYAKKRFWLLGIIVIVIGVIALSSGGGGDDDKKVDTAGESTDTNNDSGSVASAGENDEVDDVKIDTCGRDDTTNFGKAAITVTNNSSDPSSYAIEIKFESADGKTSHGTGSAFITQLNNGQTQMEEVLSFADFPDGGVCTIADVERLAS